MADGAPLFDVTGTVPLDDAAATAAAVEGILARNADPADFDRDLLHASFAFVDRLFAGRHPGYLACDMPYHDLRHSLDAALAMARLVDGGRSGDSPATASIAPEFGLVAVLLALLHDTGFLRTTAEAALCGPQLAAWHESRSVAFAEAYLRGTSIARHAALAPMILATRVAASPAPVFDGHDATAVAIGRMLGSADLLCQVADRRYVERCFHHLYPELVLGGGDRTQMPDGTQVVLFRDARDLVARTPGFYAAVVEPRLVRDFANVALQLASHFGGHDPYAASIRNNLDRCKRVVAEDRWDLVGEPPPTTTRDLDPRYEARQRSARASG